MLGLGRLARRPRRSSVGSARAARGLARPARPYFYPPPSAPVPARRDSSRRRAMARSSRRHSPRDQAADRDRRGPAGRGGVSLPPPLGQRLPRVPRPAGRRVSGGGSYCPPGPERADAAPPTGRRPAEAVGAAPWLSRLLFRHRGRLPLLRGPARPTIRPAPALPSPGQAAGGGAPERAR